MHLLTLQDLTVFELENILSRALELKAKPLDWNRPPQFAGSVLGMLFEKSSLRTRVSFESAIAHLGGSSIFLGEEAGWGKRESIADFGRVLSQYLDALVFRGNSHEELEELANSCNCAVINGLTDKYHPCQTVADILTLREKNNNSESISVAYVGDCNNVARSLAIGCAMTNIELRIASPIPYHFPPEFLAAVKEKYRTAIITLTDDIQGSVSGADAVYTDVWTSMGQEEEQAQRRADFADYQVNSELMSLAKPTACFLHCLPAKRGVEVTDEVLDGPQSVVIAQAGNRLHAQKAILDFLLSSQSKAV